MDSLGCVVDILELLSLQEDQFQAALSLFTRGQGGLNMGSDATSSCCFISLNVSLLTVFGSLQSLNHLLIRSLTERPCVYCLYI